MNQRSEPARSKPALRRLILLLVAAVILIIFAYGWQVTDIDFTVTQQPQRQENVASALSELLSPNVFERDYTIQNTTTTFLMTCSDGFTAPTTEATPDQPYIEITPACGQSGDTVTVHGYNFYPDSLARINWIATDGERRIRQVNNAGEDNFITNGDGTFNVEIEVPRIRGSSGETHSIEAQGRFPSGPTRFSETTGLVAEKMVETIFLALIATAISIVPSAILSFFAAHNLMRPVRIPLGNLLVAFILFPVGYWIGTALLSIFASFALNLSSGSVGLSAAGVVVLFGAVASSQRIKIPTPAQSIPRSVLMTVVVVVVAVLVIGLLGGIALLIDHVQADGIIGNITSFIGSLGELIQLLLAPTCGIIGAFGLASIGSTIARPVLRQLSIPAAHGLGAVMGMLSGAILLGIVASIGMSAAWLGLLVPVTMAALASPLLPQLYRRFVSNPLRPVGGQKALLTVLSIVGAVAAFVITFNVLGMSQALIEGVLPPPDAALSFAGLNISAYMLKAMVIGAILAGITGGLQGTRANFGIGSVLYNVTRTILNTLRSIEPLIMGIVFVIWVGIGPFAGVLALALHSIASLGKLYSEQIETIDSGPIEALQSTGANRLQTIMYAVVPQIVPSYIAFTMYRWDINVRMSTIIGFVGGGGIGFLLQQQINLLRYRDAGVAVLAIAIVVSILDYASAAIRERYI
ncbi:MAG: ABC transporter permease subunit [Anaerolineae bacterium]